MPPYTPSILQAASDKHAIIFDVLALQNNKLFQELIQRLFRSNDVIKAGHLFMQNDLKNFRTAFPVECYATINNFVDIATLHLQQFPASKKTSLQHLSAVYLRKLWQRYLQRVDKGILKTQQTTDWNQRPLTRKQIQYAITDAYVILHVLKAQIPTLENWRSFILHDTIDPLAELAEACRSESQHEAPRASEAETLTTAMAGANLHAAARPEDEKAQ
jgi:ribonuclease D